MKKYKNLNIRVMSDILDVLKFGDKVFVRVDFNVPLKDEGRISGTERIDKSLKTIVALMGAGAKVVLCSHLEDPQHGREDGKSLIIIKDYLAKSLKKEVIFADCFNGVDTLKDTLKSIKDPFEQLVLLENIRFCSDEKAKSEKKETFAKFLASHFDYYVFDGFGVAHRPHASVIAGKYLPSFAGYLMEEELEAFSEISNILRPSMIIIGGSKASSKILSLEGIVQKFDKVAIMGWMAYIFGCAIMNEKIELDEVPYIESQIEEARTILAIAEKSGCEMLFPVDVVIFNEETNEIKEVSINTKLEKNWKLKSVGNNTLKSLQKALDNSQSVVWNGPIASNIHPFNDYTYQLANYIAALTKSGKLVSYCGGGDTGAIAKNVDGYFNFISTGGGTLLELISDKKLLGVEILKA